MFCESYNECKEHAIGQLIILHFLFIMSDIILRHTDLPYSTSQSVSHTSSAATVNVVRRRPHYLNIFSSESTGPITVKFHMELLWDWGTKVCSNGPGHMAKMADMPIYGKKLKTSSFLELGMHHRVLE